MGKKRVNRITFFKERTQTLKESFYTIFTYTMLYNPLLLAVNAHTMENISGLQDEFESYSKYFTHSSTDSFIMWTEPFTVTFTLKI